MTTDFTIGQGDRLPVIRAALTSAGSAIDLTDCDVSFWLRPVGGGAALGGTATVDSASGGSVSYAWGTADTASAGDFEAEWEITDAGGKKLTVPNGEKLHIQIVDDIA